jgi:putative toxin-antitoxin system antitoxin component (TIGR02293 family)
MSIALSKIDKLADLQTLPPVDLAEAITAGLPAVVAREMATRLVVTMEEMAALLHLTPRTMQRRMESGSLEFGESERLWELARVFFRAIEVLDGEPAAVNWFKSPIQVLGWVAPISLASTAVGLRELENILGRIEHGVFS